MNNKQQYSLRAILFVSLLLSSLHAVGQNLISRTLNSLPSTSTNNPNLIAQSMDNFKSEKSLDLFSNDKSGIANEQEVDLNINLNSFKALKDKGLNQVSAKIRLSSSTSFDINLKRVQVFTDAAQVKDQTGKIYPMGSIHTFRGVLSDDPNSLVSLCIIGKSAHVAISDHLGNYVISSNDNENYKITVDNSIQEGNSFCGRTDEETIQPSESYNPEVQVNSNDKAAGDIVEVFVECDYQLFQNEGGVPQSLNLVTALFNEISTLYSNEGITLQVSDVFVWTSNDPYSYSMLANSQNLGDFAFRRQNNYSGRLAALLQGYRSNSRYVSGIASVDVLCATYNSSNNRGPYSVTNGIGRYPINSVPTYSIGVSVVAHELGHNFGSYHTHTCVWGPQKNRRIDNCVNIPDSESCPLVRTPTPSTELGTIMSYCGDIDFTKGFGTEPGALIYNNYLAAGCLTTGGSNNDPCTHFNKSYTNVNISGSRIVRADNNITFNGVVNINNFANVFLQMENSLSINGTINLSNSAELIIMAEDCD